MKKKSQFQSLKDILGGKYSRKGFIKNRKGQSGEAIDFLNFVKMWPSVVGERLAKVSLPLKIQNQTLIILSKHSAFSHHLDYMGSKILEILSQKYPQWGRKIKRIQFQSNDVFFEEKKAFITKQEAKKKPSPSKFDPEYLSALSDLEEKFSHVKDEEIRKQLISLDWQLFSDND